MTFRGWPAEALDFFEGLEADNSKVYWTEHKQVYEELVRAPMVELLAELEPEFGGSSIFRPHRDLRFSADKSPYKTEIGAVLDCGGYVRLSADGLGAGRGIWQLDPRQLENYRPAVADDGSGSELTAVIRRLSMRGIEVNGYNLLKSAPRGYPRDHPRIELLRYKGLAAFQTWPAAGWLGTAKAKERVVTFLRAAQPLHDWLAENVGDPEPAQPRR